MDECLKNEFDEVKIEIAGIFENLIVKISYLKSWYKNFGGIKQDLGNKNYELFSAI